MECILPVKRTKVKTFWGMLQINPSSTRRVRREKGLSHGRDEWRVIEEKIVKRSRSAEEGVRGNMKSAQSLERKTKANE